MIFRDELYSIFIFVCTTSLFACIHFCLFFCFYELTLMFQKSRLNNVPISSRLLQSNWVNDKVLFFFSLWQVEVYSVFQSRRWWVGKKNSDWWLSTVENKFVIVRTWWTYWQISFELVLLSFFLSKFFPCGEQKHKSKYKQNVSVVFILLFLIIGHEKKIIIIIAISIRSKYMANRHRFQSNDGKNTTVVTTF